MYLINSVQVEKKDFIIPVENMGVWRGDGVFEAIKIHDGYPFAIDLHIERLEKSCSKVFFENIDYKKIKDDINFIANKYENGYVRTLILNTGTACLAVDKTKQASILSRSLILILSSRTVSFFSAPNLIRYFLVTESSIPSFKSGTYILLLLIQPNVNVGPSNIISSLFTRSASVNPSCSADLVWLIFIPYEVDFVPILNVESKS